MSSNLPFMIVVSIVVLLSSWSVHGQIETSAGSDVHNQVRIAQGLLEGKVLIEKVTQRKVIFYQGVKFAEAERFEHARMSTPWTGVYQAKSPRMACPQLKFPLKPEQIIEPELETSQHDEDCLYMNIWRPLAMKGEQESWNKSVMLYIIGGGYEDGNIFKYAHNGEHLAGIGNVVVVTFNYRLGPFGFLNLGQGHDNLGMYDQLLALDWVRQNIPAFGGDPQQITIFGNSAGSLSVGGLIISPLATGRFQRGIMQSGAPNSWINYESQKQSMLKTRKLAALVDCNYESLKAMLECLRPKSSQEIMDAFRQFKQDDSSFAIAYGSEFWPASPIATLKAKKIANVQSLIFGTVKDEGVNLGRARLDKLIEQNNLTLAGIEGGIAGIIGHWDDSLVKMYTDKLDNNSSDIQLKKAFDLAYADWSMVCPMIYFAQSMATSNARNLSEHIFSYRLDQPLDAYGCNRTHGVCHAVDVHFVFGLPITYANSTRIQPPYTQADYHLSVNIIQAWTHFAKTGKPGSLDNVAWTKAFPNLARVDDVHFMRLFPSAFQMFDQLAQGRCKLWESVLFK